MVAARICNCEVRGLNPADANKDRWWRQQGHAATIAPVLQNVLLIHFRGQRPSPCSQN